MTLNKRLKEIRISKGLTQKNMAEFLGITERGYRHYENGDREPDIKSLIAIADFFAVSLDYLCGRKEAIEK